MRDEQGRHAQCAIPYSENGRPRFAPFPLFGNIEASLREACMCRRKIIHGPCQAPDTVRRGWVMIFPEAVDDLKGQPACAEEQKARLPLFPRPVERQIQPQPCAIKP